MGASLRYQRSLCRDVVHEGEDVHVGVGEQGSSGERAFQLGIGLDWIGGEKIRWWVGRGDGGREKKFNSLSASAKTLELSHMPPRFAQPGPSARTSGRVTADPSASKQHGRCVRIP